MWLNSLKIAIVQKDADALGELIKDIPKLTDASDIQEAIHLLKAATDVLVTLQDETSASMKQIKKNLQFLRSTEIPTSIKLDITS